MLFNSSGGLGGGGRRESPLLFGKSFRTALIPLTASVPMAAYTLHNRPSLFRKYDLDDCEPAPTPRYRPPSIYTLCAATKFSRKEVQIMYRAFKQGCPCGTVTLEQFQEIYSQFFPAGNVKKYSEYVFRTFDRDNDGMISFEEFVVGLSVISRGSPDEKLGWIFDLYDINHRGRIGQSELLLVVNSVYELLGKNTEPPINRHIIANHVVELFKKMDEDHDGVVTRNEFISMCKRDNLLVESLSLFDTRL